MVTFDSGADPPAHRGHLVRSLFSSGHQAIGLNYLGLALFSVFLGMAMSLLMRVHLVWPSLHVAFLASLDDSHYAALATLHGSLMVFLVLTTAPQAGFGNYFLPLQIGASDVAFPALNRLAFWATALSLFGITAAFLIPPQQGITLWIFSVALFCAAALVTALNFSVTTIDLRTPGMSLPRMPVTVWAWFINAILGTLIFSILLAACLCLLSDRLLASQFFPPLNLLAHQPAGRLNGFSALWQRLFWFFAQGQVYVAILPSFGLVTHLIATFSRKPVWQERLVVLALCAVGVFGFVVWGEHMFATGMNPFSPMAFSLLASSLGLPASVLVLSWLATLWRARPELNTSTLFAAGFISLFLTGGISGIFLARRDLALAVSISDDFITGHFHLVMGVAATFAILAALFFWFPKMFGRRLNESLGRLHFWLTFTGVYCIFMPMHWLGLISQAKFHSAARLAAAAALAGRARTFITVAIVITVFAQGIFFINFLWSLFRGEVVAEKNPWRATTVEPSLASPPPADNFGL